MSTRQWLISPSLVIMVVIVLTLGGGIPAQAATTVTPSLVQIIFTSQWSRPSPDPSGITYWKARDHLLISDAEVDEMPQFCAQPATTACINVFESTRTGGFIDGYSTLKFSKEPNGIELEIDPTTGQWFFSDDGKLKIFQISLGPDGRLGTNDDTISSFNVNGKLIPAYAGMDVEGLALGGGKLFLAGGTAGKIFVVDPGNDGRFNGAAPEGDDVVTTFDTTSLGIPSPEGIDFNPVTGLLYIVGAKGTIMLETTAVGQLQRTIDLKPFGIKFPGDVTLAPGSTDPTVQSLYLTDRGVDNNVDPNENDGRIFEFVLPAITLPPDTTPPTVTITAPAAGTTVSESVAVAATASDNVGVVGVQFTLDGTPLGTEDTSPPYDLTWNTATTTNGGHTLAATVRDAAGNTTTATPVSIIVNNTTPPPPSNLLTNAGFETDANGDSTPDGWAVTSSFSRSTAIAPQSGSFVGQFAAPDNTDASTQQTVATVMAGQTYTFGGWVNIPAQGDTTFTLKLQVIWKDATNGTLRTDTLSQKKTTMGWQLLTQQVTAPTGATKAVFKVTTISMNGSLYIDNVSLGS